VGSSIYRFTHQSIEEMRAGNPTPMSLVLLEAPRVVQDSLGALYLRGEHTEIQHRIDGIKLPQGIPRGLPANLESAQPQLLGARLQLLSIAGAARSRCLNGRRLGRDLICGDSYFC
jgi:hypothetical protein